MRFIKCLLIICSLFLFGNGFSQQVKSVKINEVGQLIEEAKGPLIINMWATWCKPCVEEIPYFLEEINTYNASAKRSTDSIHIYFISLDFKDSYQKVIPAFVKKRKINAPVWWLDETNADYFCPKFDPEWSGAIPATLFVNNQTGYRKLIEEQISHDELKKAIMAILKTD